jgi:hypothetical protein
MEASLMIHSWNLISLLSARALSYCTVEMRWQRCSETKFWPGTLFYFASQVSLSWIRNVMEIGTAYDNFHLHTFGRYDSVPPAQSIIIIIIISNRNTASQHVQHTLLRIDRTSWFPLWSSSFTDLAGYRGTCITVTESYSQALYSGNYLGAIIFLV